MSNNARILFLSIILSLICLCFNLNAVAQNNPYKINDELYAYLSKCMKVIKQEKVLTMSDTLFNMSKKKRDLKAQCLALNLKGEYYYYNNNIKHLTIEKERIGNFARKTPYKQYVFSIWNRIINYYANQQMVAIAMNEARKYQKEALLLNDKYGIGMSYQKLADLYQILGNPNQALAELNKAADYLRNNGKEYELFNVYAAIGNVYYSLNNYKQTEKYYLMALEKTPIEASKGGCLISLASNSLDMNNLPAVEKYINLFNNYKKTYPLTPSLQNKETKFYAKYYNATKDFDKAIAYCNSLPSIDKYSYLADTYRGKGDYKNAFDNLIASNEYTKTLMNEKQNNSLAEYTALFDKDRVENEKNILALQNAQLKMNQLKTREELLMADKQQNLLKLTNTRLELNNKELALQRQKTENEKQRADTKHQIELFHASEQQAKTNKLLILVLVFFLIVLAISFIAYIILRKRSSRQLKKEMIEVTKTRNEAETARNEAVKANKLKSQFMQNMSHEIRTPLNAIVGFSDMLADQSIPTDDNEKEEFAKLIHTNSNILTTLINDILDISIFETGTYKLIFEKISVSKLCMQATDSVQNLVPKGVKLKCIIPNEDIILNTDELRVQQLLTNFLTNACKYTEKGSITLAYERTENNIIFSVTDTGCGISPENADRIFQRFEKLNPFKQGSGLGLNICQHIAELLHGEVKLDTQYTKGSRFLFIHPIE